jgi:hypothetical protein
MIDIHDIKPLVHMAGNWAGWIGAAGGVILAAVLAWWFFNRRRAQEALLRSRPSPQDQAFDHLDALASEAAIDGKAFYFRLSAILRYYIEQRFGVPAAEMTLEELLPCVHRLPLPVDLAHGLESFSRSAEPIKFAAAAADSARMTADLLFVRSFVQRTASSVKDQF